MDIQTIFIENLKRLRDENNVSQSKMAEHIDMSSSQIAHIENGRNNPTFPSIQKIADFFKVPVYTLFMSCEDRGMFNKQQVNDLVGDLEKVITKRIAKS